MEPNAYRCEAQNIRDAATIAAAFRALRRALAASEGTIERELAADVCKRRLVRICAMHGLAEGKASRLTEHQEKAERIAKQR